MSAEHAELTKAPASIQALSVVTVRQIGSSKAIVDPSSVVKELIENSLDARATAVFVEIAANTLDTIQVRDNGHGIPTGDRDLVCRRYCTSKLRDYNDLAMIGGKWLGFRGEALACVAELSGTMVVTTRVEGEPVATSMMIGKDGEIEGAERASSPIGTSVKIAGLFHTLPVRKQTAKKDSARYLAKIKRMMQAYALARPSVRFSLRVLKAKTDKSNWAYAPAPGANVEDAAFKVIGRNCASQCEWIALESDGYKFQAFLPKPNAVGSKIMNEGSFISIDSRPVSTSRGAMRKIVALFEDRLKKCNQALASTKSPFMCMDIVCPLDSYDPNIEPAKDDVLFNDFAVVLAGVEKLLRSHYPDADPDHEMLFPTNSAQRSSEVKSIPRPKLQNCNRIRQDVNEPKLPTSHQPHPAWRSNMYDIDEADLELLSREGSVVEVEEEVDEEARRAWEVLNPWTIARMNVGAKAGEPTANAAVSGPHGQLLTPLKECGNAEKSTSPPVSATTRQGQLVFQPLTPQTMPSSQKISRVHEDTESESGLSRNESLETPQGPVANENIQSRIQKLAQPFAGHPNHEIPWRSIPEHRNYSSLERWSDAEERVADDSFIWLNGLSLAPGDVPMHRTHDDSSPRLRQTSRKRKAPKGNQNLALSFNRSRPLRDGAVVRTDDNWFSNYPPQGPAKDSKRRKQGNQPPPCPAVHADQQREQFCSKNNTDIRAFFGQNRQRVLAPAQLLGPVFGPSVAPINQNVQQPAGGTSIERTSGPSTLPLNHQPRKIVEHLQKRRQVSPSNQRGNILDWLQGNTEQGDTLTNQYRMRVRSRHHSTPHIDTEYLQVAMSTQGAHVPDSTTPSRSESSKNRPERISRDFWIQNHILTISTSLTAILQDVSKLDMVKNSLQWHFDLANHKVKYEAFAQEVSPRRLHQWGEEIELLLRDVWKIEDGVDEDEVVTCLKQGIEEAFKDRKADEDEDENSTIMRNWIGTVVV